MQAGYWLSFLDDQEQGWVLEIYKQYRKLPSGNCAQKLREQAEDHVLTRDSMENLILRNGVQRLVRLKASRIDRFFPAIYEAEQIEEIIYELLEQWKKEQEETD